MNNSFTSSYSFASRSNSILSSSSFASGFEMPLDKTLHLKDNSCNCCGSSFSQVCKKNCCAFCYRGVCDNCFNQLATHPDTQESTKICDACFDKLLNKGVNQLERLRCEISELQDKYEHEKRATLKEIAMKQDLESELKKLINLEKTKESETLNLIQTLKEKNAKLSSQNTIMTSEYNSKNLEMHSLEKRIKNLQDEAEILKKKHMNMNTAESIKQAIGKIKGEIDEIKNEVELKDNESCANKVKEYELSLQKENLKEEIAQNKDIFEQLSKKIKNLEEEDNIQKDKIESLENTMNLIKNKESSFLEIPNSRFAIEYNNIKKEINEKQDVINVLKQKIKRMEGSMIIDQ